MQDEKTKKQDNNTKPADVKATDAKPADAKADDATKAATDAAKAAEKVDASTTVVTPPQENLVKRIVEKIKTSENILVALSRDPSVDEMAAALGLTLFLDGLQKHTTAVFSGQTPSALAFLQPEGTFEANTDSLQDFIVALSKDKADHLRYKLDGDFVKVYITPYKTTLSEADLEFSHGDYNVDLVLALGVPAASDLDDALNDHARIMHDATTVDITCDVPGKFGELEWSDPGASSVSEMVTELALAVQGANATLEKDVAMALLTGIVAATERFSNGRTSPETMELASKLMEMGADQQLIASNVIGNDPGVMNSSEFYVSQTPVSPVSPVDNTNLLVGQDYGMTPVAPMEGTVIQPDVPMNEPAAEDVTLPEVAMPVAPEASEAMVAPEVPEMPEMPPMSSMPEGVPMPPEVPATSEAILPEAPAPEVATGEMPPEAPQIDLAELEASVAPSAIVTADADALQTP